MRRRYLYWPKLVNYLLIGAGALLIGGRVAVAAAPTPPAKTIVERGTRMVTTTKTVKKVVRGRVIHLPGQQVVLRIPYIVVRTDGHKIVVPAHTVGLPSPQAAVAKPKLPVTITIYVPTTVYVPVEPVTTTETVEVPPVTVTTTVSLPILDPTTGGLPTTGW